MSGLKLVGGLMLCAWGVELGGGPWWGKGPSILLALFGLLLFVIGRGVSAQPVRVTNPEDFR